MKVTFDENVRIAGIGLVPWTRLGPERWFPHYKIASLYGWDITDIPGIPEVLALSDQPGALPVLEKMTSQQLINTPAFQRLIRDNFAGYHFLTYKPVQTPPALQDADVTFVSMNQTLTQSLENKVEFREQFADLGIPLPAYDTYTRASLHPATETLHKLLKNRSSVILQDEMLSGGRGTFVVSTVDDLRYALESIELLGGGQRVVVSEHITLARERSVQGCATRYGIFIGPLQKQIIGDPLLANLDVPNGDRFCGAEISPDDPLQPIYAEIKGYASKIGQRLTTLGYRGIFSVDCLVDEAGQVYVLEVNPRLTGITPLLTALYREGKDIPFYLLHILETANIEYAITDDAIDTTPPTGSLLIVHAHSNQPATITQAPHSGLYGHDGTFLGKAYRLNAAAPYLVQRYTPPLFPVKPGGRIVSILSSQPVVNARDELLPEAIKVVHYLQQNTKLKELA